MKAASDIYAPVTTEIMEVNTALAYEPSKINGDAERQGWLSRSATLNLPSAIL